MKAELLDTNGAKIAPAPLSHTEAIADQLGERDRRAQVMELALQTIKNRLIRDIREIGISIQGNNRDMLRGNGLPPGAIIEAGQIAIHFLGMVAEQVKISEMQDGRFCVALPIPDEPAPKKTRRRSRT